MIRIKSDFSDSLNFSRAVKKIASSGMLSVFDDVLFHLTSRDDVSIRDGNLYIRIRYRKLNEDSMLGLVSMLSNRALMLFRMDFSFLDSFKPEQEWFDDKMHYSRVVLNMESIRQYLKNYIADYHGLRKSIREFPDQVFSFMRDEIVSDGDVFHNFRKPLYIWVWRDHDTYNYEYLDEICKCPDIRFQLALLSNSFSDRDFLEFSKEMVVAISRFLEG